MKQITNKCLVIILIPAICWLFTSALVFQHSHILANGDVITHSHPYTPNKNHSPFQSHKHSSESLFSIGQISHPHALTVSSITSIWICLQKIHILPIQNSSSFHPHDFSYYGIYRAPPTVSFSKIIQGIV